jgi:NADH-quinone oxidoreductase subunit N
VLGLLNSAVAAYYYLRVLVMMYFREPGAAANEAEPLTPGVSIALAAPAAATLFLGIFPSWVLGFIEKSSSLLK